MAKRMPKEVHEYLQSLGRHYGKMGGKAAAANMTAKQRRERATKASQAAAKKRTAERLERERAARRVRRRRAG